MKKIIQILIIIVVIFSSCKKEKEEIYPIQTTPHDTLTLLYKTSGGLSLSQNSTSFLNDSTIIMAGHLDKDILILNVSKSGEEIWRNKFDAGHSSDIASINQVTTNEIFAYGSTRRNYSINKTDLLLIKMNTLGDTIWTKSFGGVQGEIGHDIIKTSDNNLLLSGSITSYVANDIVKIFLMKINFEGDTLWTNHFSNQVSEYPCSLLETKNGNYLITGYNDDSENQKGLYFLKVNSNGEKLWDCHVDAGISKFGYSTIELSNGDFMTCGEYFYEYGSAVMVIKTDGQGNKIWEKVYGENNKYVFGNSIRQNSDDAFTIIGSAFNINPNGYEIIVFKIDNEGNEEWFKQFGKSKSNWGISILKEMNDDNLISGIYDGDIFLARIDNEGNYK